MRIFYCLFLIPWSHLNSWKCLWSCTV